MYKTFHRYDMGSGQLDNVENKAGVIDEASLYYVCSSRSVLGSGIWY